MKPAHITFAVPICESCVHLGPREDGEPGFGCAAFPRGIPDAIYGEGFDHRQPYPGDHGVQWEQKPGEEQMLERYEESRA